ncbi:hypothetical protein VTK26DRAFT_4819 [Humicola hyalothermophila]
MALTSYIVNGRRVSESDLILDLKVLPDRDLASFWGPNKARIDQNSVGANDSTLDRRARAGTAELESCIVVLTFSNPPGQSRSHFVIGRDSRACDIVCPHPRVSSTHIKIGFDEDHIVLYDVSSSGSHLTLNDRGRHPTHPKPGAPYRCILPPDCRVKLEIPGFELTIQVRARKGAALEEFRRKRDALLAQCSDIGALSLASRVATQPATQPVTPGPWRPMYYFESEIGKGAYGVVHKVHRLHDWAVFAAKELSVQDPGELRREMLALKPLQHPRIAQFVDWYEDRPGNWILVMEYCPYVAEGLAYLHHQGITHRDLKPENILVRSRDPLSVALSDFGLAKSEHLGLETVCGTDPYMAPELWSFAKYTRAVDIWALGVVGIQLLDGKLPDPVGVVPSTRWTEAIFKRAEALHDSNRENLLVAIVRKMLAEDPRDRPPAEECIEDAEDVLQGLSSPQRQAPKRGPASASTERQAQDQRTNSAAQPSLDLDRPSLRSSEIRTSQLERLFMAAAPLGGQPQPSGPSRHGAHDPSATVSPAEAQRKRGTAVLARSNTYEAAPRKVARSQQAEDQASAQKRARDAAAVAAQGPAARAGPGPTPSGTREKQGRGPPLSTARFLRLLLHGASEGGTAPRETRDGSDNLALRSRRGMPQLSRKPALHGSINTKGDERRGTEAGSRRRLRGSPPL